MTSPQEPLADPTVEELNAAKAELNRRRNNGETIVDDADFIVRELERKRVAKPR